MRDKIDEIVVKVESGHLEPNEATSKLFDLCGVIAPKGTLLFHLKALTKKIEDSHCYGFEDILEDYIKSNAL